jgi:hypothetical protein
VTNKLRLAQPVISLTGILRTGGRLLFGILPAVFMLLCLGTPTQMRAQTTATVSGTVEDTTGAVIPGATVTLINDATHTQIDAVSSSSGLYAFSSVIPGTYTIRAIEKGFAPKELTGVILNAGDTKEMPPLQLAVGSASQTVTVEAITQMIPMSTGTRSDVLDYSDIQNIDLEGRDVTELLKVLPGVVETPNGLSNGPSFSAITVTSQTSAVGNGLNISGAEYRGPQSLLSDGVDVIDPGDMGGSIGTVTPEMTQEVSVLTSDFGADQEFGPVVVSTISRSGGDQYHGEAYFDARNDALNANDWLDNNGGHPKAGAAYYYPGGNFGGPVPKTHKKLFFWGGYERWLQNQGNANILESYIPSPAMMSGDFTTDNPANVTLCGYNGGAFTSSDTGHWCNDLTGTDLPAGDALIPAAAGHTGHMIPSDDISAASGPLSSFWPKVWNADGTPNPAAGYSNPATTPGGYDYFQAIINHVNGWVWRARVDWHWTDKTQAYISYQQEYSSSLDQGNGAHIYWTPGDAIPYPGGGLYQFSYTKTAAGHLIHEFGPTLTNELIASWGEGNLPNEPANTMGAWRSTLGYPTGAGFGEVFAPGSKLAPAYNQSYTQYQGPDFSQGDDYEPSGIYQVRKEDPSFADNLTKVIRAHTVKLGFYTQNTSNYQGGGQQMNGIFNTFQLGGNVWNDPFLGYPIGSPNNPTANFIMGVVPSYSEANKSPNSDMAYQSTAAYLNDNWKVTRRVTVEIGARFEHVSHWYDRTGNGMAVFYPNRVASDYYAGKAEPGFYWHAIDAGVPLSGYPNRLFFLSPRFGLSIDVFGNGKTMVRGGWGAYRWADQYNDYAAMLQTATNIQSYNSPSQINLLEGEIGFINTPLGASLGLAPSGVAGTASFCNPASSTTELGIACVPGISGGEEGADPTDYGIPLTYSWNLTIDQQLPWNSLFDIAYVGSDSSQMDDNGEESNGSNYAGYANQNKVPIGAFFKPDPVTNVISDNPEDLGENTDGTSTGNKEADYHPYALAYGANSVTMDQMTFYSNYNALQASWTKRAGHFIFDFNYTWQKQLGTAAYQTNPFYDRADYGVLNVDRPWLFNSDYIYQFGNLLHANAFADGAVNGWTISGITSIQGGGNLQNEQGANLGMGQQYVDIPSTLSGVGSGLSSNTYYGTDAGLAILPELTCNPKSGLKKQNGFNQILNLSCFTLPPIGQQGGQNFPYLSNQRYVENDLALYKTFNIHEQQNIQFRISAFNWMNHPLQQMNGGNQIAPFYDVDYQTHAITWVTNQNSPNPGYLNEKSGTPTQRIMELNLKYNF